MANVSEEDRQEIIQATLIKAFEKLSKKGILPQDKVETLKQNLAVARNDLLAAKSVREECSAKES